MKKKIFVEGMKCEKCAGHVNEALAGLEGVINVEVNLVDKNAIIETTHDLSNESLKLAVNSEKYSVIGIEEL
ncbi:heavy-metal-associated domain-containing protein [Neobacillus sp. LXY-4]|uniref:heavy-metal-associated domain-containing protein n=1 Tax=Neobacillus sp. LXY-4 TaxID=3379826 RepID=UPI003EE13AAC